MRIKDWYRVLLEDRVLMSPATDSSPAILHPVRVESLHPSTDWPNTWRLARLRGLPSDLSSLLFRLLHGLLPSQDRVARLGGPRDPNTRGLSVVQGLYNRIHKPCDVYL